MNAVIGLGEPAPWFKARSNVNPSFAFDTVGGRYVAMAFLPEVPTKEGREAVQAIAARPELFDDFRAAPFFVLPRAEDGPWAPILGELRRFYDEDGTLRKLWGSVTQSGGLAPGWYVLDPLLRLVLRAPLGRTDQVLQWLDAAPPLERYAGVEVWAPVLVVPYVFEPAFCRRLIDEYHRLGGEPSGFMRDVNGKTTLLHDASHKRRSDATLEDEALKEAARNRILRRLVPELKKAFQFTATRMERYIVACYDAESGGYFRRHRDNTTAGTAHRRFAVSINLNAEEFQGGDLRFPEFGPRTYRPPTGGAVAFSCSLLHEATPVTGGKRYAFLPFLYDEVGARIREENSKLLADGAEYKAGPLKAVS